MNKDFLEDLQKTVELRNDSIGILIIDHAMRIQIYIAEKLWSIEQLLKHQGGR